MAEIYVIAEMACSHDGSVQLAKKIVEDAVEARANAISIHLTSVPDCISIYYKTGKGRVSAGKEDRPFYDYLKEISLSFDQWKEVLAIVRKRGIDLVLMPNDEPSFEFAENCNPEAYVIPASNFEEYSFIKKIGVSGKPVFLRVGGATLGEIEEVVKILKHANSGQITLLYGHQNYPTGIEDANLGFIQYLKNSFKLPVGIADHVDGEDEFAVIAPLLAISLGISCIEKHLTHDRSKKGEDFEAALNKIEFKKMVQNIRKAELALKDKGLIQFTANTDFYRKTLRKRVVASRDLKEGEVMTNSMTANKRSDEGIFPSQLELVLGMTLKQNIPEDRGIKLDHFRVPK